MIFCDYNFRPYLVGDHESRQLMERAQRRLERISCLRIWGSRPSGQEAGSSYEWVDPFAMLRIKLNKKHSTLMAEVITRRIEGRIWEKIPENEIGKERFILWKFIAWDGDWKSRSTADLLHISEH